MKRRDFAKALTLTPMAGTSALAAPTPAARRKELYSLMGDLPPRDRRISAQTVSIEERPSYTVEKLVLDLNGVEPVPAYFVKPKGPTRESAIGSVQPCARRRLPARQAGTA